MTVSFFFFTFVQDLLPFGFHLEWLLFNRFDIVGYALQLQILFYLFVGPELFGLFYSLSCRFSRTYISGSEKSVFSGSSMH